MRPFERPPDVIRLEELLNFLTRLGVINEESAQYIILNDLVWQFALHHREYNEQR